MATDGIPPGFDIITGALYEKDTAQVYAKVLVGQVGHRHREHSRRRSPPRMRPADVDRPSNASAASIAHISAELDQHPGKSLMLRAPVRQARIRPAGAASSPSCSSSGRSTTHFLSPLNISNTLAFTVELGLIALAMTLLMTSGEFDLSVGSVFGFTPVLMWTLFNAGSMPLEVAFVIALVGRRPDRAGQRPVRDAAEDTVLPGDARHAAGRARHGAVHHRRLSAAHLERRRPLAVAGAGRRFLHRSVPHLHVAVLVHPRGGRSSATC